MKQLHDGKWYNTELAEEIAESRFAKNCEVVLALTEPPIMPCIDDILIRISGLNGNGTDISP